jgi:hypothetical protein
VLFCHSVSLSPHHPSLSAGVRSSSTTVSHLDLVFPGATDLSFCFPGAVQSWILVSCSLRGFCSLGRSAPRPIFSLRYFRSLIPVSRSAFRVRRWADLLFPLKRRCPRPKICVSRSRGLAVRHFSRYSSFSCWDSSLVIYFGSGLWPPQVFVFCGRSSSGQRFFLRKQLSASCLCFSDSICRLCFPRFTPTARACFFCFCS